MNPCQIVKGVVTVAVEVASALHQLVDVWSFPHTDALWLSTSSPTPADSDGGMPGDRPEAAASTGSAQGPASPPGPGSLGAPLTSFDLFSAANSCRFHGNNTYPETRRNECFDLAERLEHVATALHKIEAAK